MDIGLVSGVISLALGLLLFGIGYNYLVQYLQAKHYTEGFDSLLVAGGVTVTLLGLAILSWQSAVLAFGAFVCSGLPMIVGSIMRYVTRRENEQKEIVKKALAELAKKEIPNEPHGPTLAK